MQIAGRPSWQLASGTSDACEIALFVRDRAGLPAADIPRLIGDVPVRPAQAVDELGSQWPQWWAQMVGDDSGHALDGLAAWPALQDVALGALEDHRTWRRSVPDVDRELLDWSLMKQTAEDVAIDRGVSIDEVRATVRCVRVDGIWWQSVRPGVVLCSPAAAADAVTAQRLLYRAFSRV